MFVYIVAVWRGVEMEIGIGIAAALAFVGFILMSIALMRAFDGRRLFERRYTVYHPWWIYSLRVLGTFIAVVALRFLLRDNADLGKVVTGSIIMVVGAFFVVAFSGENVWFFRIGRAKTREQVTELKALKALFESERGLSDE